VGALDAEQLLQKSVCSGALARVSLSPINDLTAVLTGHGSTLRASRRLHLAMQVQRLLEMRLYFLELGRLQTVHREPANLVSPGQPLLQYHQLDTRDTIPVALRLQP